MTTNNHQFHLLSPEKKIPFKYWYHNLLKSDQKYIFFFYPCCYGNIIAKNAKYQIAWPLHKQFIYIWLLISTCFHHLILYFDGWFMVFNATFNNISVISWWSILVVEETGENHRAVASHWQTLSHNVVHLALIEIWTHNISGDRPQRTLMYFEVEGSYCCV